MTNNNEPYAYAKGFDTANVFLAFTSSLDVPNLNYTQIFLPSKTMMKSDPPRLTQ